MLELARGGFTRQEVIDALHAKRGTREIKIKYNLLDKTEQFIGELKNVMGGRVDFAAMAQIKRTAKFKIKDGNIGFARKIPKAYALNVWDNTTNVIASDNTLTKNAGVDDWANAGAISREKITSGNGWLQCEVARVDKDVFFGLSGDADSNKSYADINYALYFMGAQIAVYENGVYKNIIRPLKVGDIAKIAVIDGVVKFYLNNELLYTSALTPTYPLYADTSFYNVGATLKNLIMYKYEDFNAIDWLSDRIQPVVMLKMPGGSWVEFPQGVFVLSTPSRKDESGGVVRDVEAYDTTIVLLEDKFDAPYTVAAGTNYKTAIISILGTAGISKYIIEDTTKTLPVDVVFDIGKDKLSAVNELLSQINYYPIRVDVNGNFVTSKYIAPSSRQTEYTYADNDLSVVYSGFKEDVDLFNVPNKWVVIRTNAEQAPIKSIYTNSSATSPTSTVNRGRTIVDVREIENIADQQSLDSYAAQIAFEASQIFSNLEFESAIMPMHEYYDILKIEYSPLGINAKYTELNWSMDLKAGGKMKHTARAVINV